MGDTNGNDHLDGASRRATVLSNRSVGDQITSFGQKSKIKVSHRPYFMQLQYSTPF